MSKKKKKKREHPRLMWQYQTIFNISINGVPKEEKENQAEKKL